MKEKIYKKLSDILKRPLSAENDDEALSQLAAWDSIALLEFIAFMDREFKVSVTQQNIEGCKTIGDLVNLVSYKKSD